MLISLMQKLKIIFTGQPTGYAIQLKNADNKTTKINK